MKKVFLAALLCCTSLSSQEYRIPPGSRIFIEEMAQDLDGYLKAEFFKKKILLRVAPTIEQADYVMTGSATEEEKRKWHQGWLTEEQDRTNANVVVIDKASGEMVWAGEAGDRSLWWGSLARGGHRKVASRLANQLKKAVFGPAAPRRESPTNDRALGPDVVSALRDPVFRLHPREVQIEILARLDPGFARLSVEAQQATLDDPELQPVSK